MSDSNNGLFASAERLAGLAIATAHNRVKLFAVELHEEKCRFIQAVLLTAGAIALGVSTLTLITITLVVLFWENSRVPVLCALSGLFIVGTCLVIRSLRRCLAAGPGFESTLNELEKDRACFPTRD